MSIIHTAKHLPSLFLVNYSIINIQNKYTNNTTLLNKNKKEEEEEEGKKSKKHWNKQ